MNVPQSLAQIPPRREIFKQLLHSVEASINRGNVDKRTFQPPTQQTISERRLREVEHGKERIFF